MTPVVLRSKARSAGWWMGKRGWEFRIRVGGYRAASQKHTLCNRRWAKEHRNEGWGRNKLAPTPQQCVWCLASCLVLIVHSTFYRNFEISVHFYFSLASFWLDTKSILIFFGKHVIWVKCKSIEIFRSNQITIQNTMAASSHISQWSKIAPRLTAEFRNRSKKRQKT